MKKSFFPGNYEISKSYSNAVSEIFQDKFDVAWLQKYRDSGSTQREWGLIEGEHAEDDGTVVYRYNNEFFRSDDFSTVHDGKHVLFAGCSETEGQGGNMEDSWGHMVFEKIKDSNNVNSFYNLGRAGFGWQKIISQTQLYIKKYGKPDLMFVLLPNVGRFVNWSNANNDWYYQQQYPRFGNNKMLDSVRDIVDDPYIPTEQSPAEYRKIFIDFTLAWRLFEDFCNAAGIKLVWATWEPIDNYNFSRLNLFQNFMPLDKEDVLDHVEKFKHSLVIADDDLNKRDGHHGRMFHRFWADSFVDEATRKGFIND